MLKQPRSATVVCSSPTLPGGGGGTDRVGGGFCVVNEIKGEDFVRMLKQSDSFLKSMKVIMRTRLFRQAWIRVFALLPLIVNIPLFMPMFNILA